MTLGMGLSSDKTGTMKEPSVKPLWQWIKTMARDVSRSDGDLKSVVYLMKWMEVRMRQCL
jgi:hypothetical protein